MLRLKAETAASLRSAGQAGTDEARQQTGRQTMLDTRFEHRISPETGMRERLIEGAWIPLDSKYDGYVPNWGETKLSAEPSEIELRFLRFNLTNKPGAQVTEAEIKAAVADIRTDPRVKHVEIVCFHPTQQRWLLDVHLVDGIDGVLKGIYSIGRIYGNLRSTQEEWSAKLERMRAEEAERLAKFEAYLKSLDDAAAEAIDMLAGEGFTVDDVIACINRMIAGRYVDEQWRMVRAYNYHVDVICPKFAHLNERDRPVPIRVGFYYGRRHRYSHAA